MTKRRIKSLVASRDPKRILKGIIEADEGTSIRIICALGMNDNFSCGRGLLLYERPGASELAKMAYTATGTLAGPFRCNACGFSVNLGLEYLEDRLDKGELGSPPAEGEPGYIGLKIAEDRLAFLEGRVTFDSMPFQDLCALFEETKESDASNQILLALARTGNATALPIIIGALEYEYDINYADIEGVRAALQAFPDGARHLQAMIQRKQEDVSRPCRALELLRELDKVDARKLPGTTSPSRVQKARDTLWTRVRRSLRGSSKLARDLFEGISENKAQRVQSALRGGADPNTVYELGRAGLPYVSGAEEGESALMCSLRLQCSIGVVKEFLDSNADPNFYDEKCAITPLHLAARHRDARIIDVLIERGADVTVADWNGKTPLHWASGLGGSKDSVVHLLAGGANPDARDKKGQTPLHEAADWYEDTSKVIEALIEGGADRESVDEFGLTPARWVSSLGEDNVVQAKKALLE